MQLPPADTPRWTAGRKAAVVNAVEHQLLGVEDACLRYQLSREELLSWLFAYTRHGIPGLRATRVQIYSGRGPKR